MLNSCKLVPAAAIIMASCLATPATSSSASAQAPVASSVEGSWIGPFAGFDWTFELKRQEGGWSGRYMSAKTNNWHDLKSVNVSGSSVTFEMVSTPVVRFELELSVSGRDLSGLIDIGSARKIPFAAVRRL
jgi:hypothetical protein